MNKNIEDIDIKIIELISRRSDLYIEELKKNSGGNDIFSPEHKSSIFNLIEKNNKGPIPNNVLKKIYNEIISSSLITVLPVKVAYLGPEGTFSDIASKEFFGESVIYIPQKTISDVFHEVESGNAFYGVVPIENSTEGAVTYTLDELMATDLSIISEKFLRVTYSLLSKSNNIEAIKKIYSHPQPLGQCKTWIKMNFPDVEICSVESTSRAAEIIAGDPSSAAIASEKVAQFYDLHILFNRIEDSKQNYTRFFVIGRKENKPTGNDKTSIVCAIKDKPGALLELLKPFSNAGINMTKIESRPDKKKMWEYNFFIDFLGHKDDSIVRNTLEKIKSETIFLKILGSYPVGN